MNWEEEAVKQYQDKINATNQQLTDLNNQKAQTLNEYNNYYNDQLNQHQELMNQQQNLVNQYEQTQQNALNNNLSRTNEMIEQNRKETQENINAEKKDAYVDYMKQINQYGGAQEQLATQGLANTGYNASERIAMYSTYQNRVSAANTAMTKANVEYDRQIKEAQDNFDVAKAQLALDTLQKSYEIALQGFEYKNTLFNNRMQFNLQLDDTYYNRANAAQNRIDNYTSQINNIYQTRDKMAEEKRQFDETMAEKKREYDQNFAEEQRQYNESLALSKAKSSGGSGGGGVRYTAPAYTDTQPTAPKVTDNYETESGQYLRTPTIGNITKSLFGQNTDKVQIAKPSGSTPKLSSSTATNLFNSFAKQYNYKSGQYMFKVSQLEDFLSNKSFSGSDRKKIANYFGLTWQ